MVLGKRKTESSPLYQHSREGVDATSGDSNASSGKKRKADDVDNDEEQDDGVPAVERPLHQLGPKLSLS